MVYEFGGFQVCLSQRVLLHNGEQVALTRKVFDTLVLLVQSGGRLLKKEELMEALWPDSFVEEGNLTQNIFVLRRILGHDQNGTHFIQTIPRQGYRFVASVKKGEVSTSGRGLLADYWSLHSPFRGLRMFETDDARLFFGRESEVNGILDRLARSPVLTIMGNSGSGKSSLLRAGLIPALRAGRACCQASPVNSWRIAVFRPSASPSDYLADVLPDQLAPELDPKQRGEFIADCRDKFPSGGETLRNAISALVRPARGEIGATRVLLVADQFEEIFTLTTNSTSKEVRDRYIDALLSAARPDSAVPVHLVLVLRADLYARCLEHVGLSRCLEVNLYNVPGMTNERLRETIEKRLQLAAAQAEPGLIESLLEDVGDEPGNLALLEHALGQLWEKCGGYGCTLTNRAYAEIGRLRGALGRHADEVYAALSDERQKRLARRVFLELVHLGQGSNLQDTRRRLPKSDLLALAAADEVELLLGRLASSRLVSTGREGGEAFVDVSHEALIREWPALREWLTENRGVLRLERRLQEAAEEWEQLNRDAAALLRGPRLAQGEDWVARTSNARPLVRAFLQACIAARDEAERKELVAQRKAATRQRLFSCLLAALNATDRLQRPADRVWQAVFSPDGQFIVTASRDHAARVWNAVDGRLVATLQGHDDQVSNAQFSPDGQRIVTASRDHTARIWSATDGALVLTLQGHTDVVSRAHFSPDGQRVATASDDHTARIWSATDGRLLLTLRGHTEKLFGAQFSPDGQRLVTTSDDHTARIWSAADGGLLATLRGPSDRVANLHLYPNGQRIVTASDEETARVWASYHP